MAYTIVPNPVPGSIVSSSGFGIPVAADLADHEARINLIANPMICVLRRDTNQSIPDAVTTDVSYTIEETDPYNLAVVTATIMTFTKAGTYILGSTISFATSGVGVRYHNLLLSGNVITADTKPNAGAGTPTSLSNCVLRKVIVGDTLKCTAFQNSGGALNVTGTSWIPATLFAVYVGP